MANPRKFSEKIALHNQKQAEETAEFERVMQECTVTRVMVSFSKQLKAEKTCYIFIIRMTSIIFHFCLVQKV